MRSLTGRMVLAGGLLMGLLLGVGWAFVALFDAPLWFPMAFAIGFVLLQYAVAPWFIRLLIPADAPDPAHPLSELVARRCRDAGIPMVRLGIIKDGTPNAFAFGRTPESAHVWVSQGLIDRLDEDELDAVVCHELGHVKHWDMAVMTVAAIVPMALYMVHIVTRRWNRPEARAVAVGSFVAYWIAELAVLAVSRARELKADDWSRRCTGHGDALASGLVKIAYGIGQAAKDKEKTSTRLGAAQVLGIMSAHDGRRMQALLADNAEDSAAAIAGLRWDRTNPWARLREKLSTHPLVATRIAMLGRPGPGAATRWAGIADAAIGSPAELLRARRRFAAELAIAVAPWAIVVGTATRWYLTGDPGWVPWALVAAGVAFFVKQRMRYPFGYQPVDGVATLLDRLDAGPVAGLPVEVRGQITGRGLPGYVLSADMVLADDSGFIPLEYTNPLPFAVEWFGLFRNERFHGVDVVARGWYFRDAGGPSIELRDVRGEPGRYRGWRWVTVHALAVALFVAGVITVLAV